MQAHLLAYTNRGSAVKHKIKELQAHLLAYTDFFPRIPVSPNFLGT